MPRLGGRRGPSPPPPPPPRPPRRPPLPPQLRARIRWVAAHALGCAYGERCAADDLLQAGAGPEAVRDPAGDHADLPEAERHALTFARTLAVKPHAVTDGQVSRLIAE